MANASEQSPMLPRAEEFKVWLFQSEGYERQRLSDTLSRARRVFRMSDVRKAKSDLELCKKLAESSDFNNCTTSVQSQLRCAARIYRRFLGKKEK